MFRRLIRWLRHRSEAQATTPPPPKRLTRIQYIDEYGQQRVAKIVGAVGFYLDVRPIESTGMQARLLSEQDVEDPQLFWEQWHAWGGDQLFYEDGRKFEI